MRRSQLLKRPPRFGQKQKTALARVEDDDGSDDDGALPFAATRTQGAADGGSLKRPTQTAASSATKPTTSRGKTQANSPYAAAPIESSTSSASEFAQSKDKKPGPISPHRRAELGRLNPGGKREGSEGGGTPSMGSSFSDLDGESTTNRSEGQGLFLASSEPRPRPLVRTRYSVTICTDTRQTPA